MCVLNVRQNAIPMIVGSNACPVPLFSLLLINPLFGRLGRGPANKVSFDPFFAHSAGIYFH